MSFLGYVSQSFTQKKRKLRLKHLLKKKPKKPTHKILALFHMKYTVSKVVCC